MAKMAWGHLAPSRSSSKRGTAGHATPTLDTGGAGLPWARGHKRDRPLTPLLPHSLQRRSSEPVPFQAGRQANRGRAQELRRGPRGCRSGLGYNRKRLTQRGAVRRRLGPRVAVGRGGGGHVACAGRLVCFCPAHNPPFTNGRLQDVCARYVCRSGLAMSKLARTMPLRLWEFQ